MHHGDRDKHVDEYAQGSYRPNNPKISPRPPANSARIAKNAKGAGICIM